MALSNEASSFKLVSWIQAGKTVISATNNRRNSRMFKRVYPNGIAFDSHAEMGAIKKALDMGIDLKGKTLWVIRFRKDGSIGCSKPCKYCEMLIREVGIKKVYYTQEDGSWAKIRISQK